MEKNGSNKDSSEGIYSYFDLNNLLKIITLRNWIVLSVFILLMIGVACWPFLGKMPLTVEAKGVLFAPSHLIPFRSFNDGFVKEIRVQTGDQVAKGDVLIVLMNPAKEQEYKNQQRLISYLEKQLAFHQEVLTEEGKIQIGEKILQAKIKADEYRQELQNLIIVAPETGIVLSMNISIGEQIQIGSEMGCLQTPILEGRDLVIHGVIPIAEGERVKVGMSARMQLDSLDWQKYGLLMGTVKEVVPSIASEEGFMQALPSIRLRNYLLSQSPVTFVLIEPLQDPKHPTRFLWTSEKDLPFTSALVGAVGKIYITVENKEPAVYVFPVLDH